MLSCATEPGPGNRVVVGCQNSALNVYDMATSRPAVHLIAPMVSASHALTMQDGHSRKHLLQVNIEGVPVILRAPTARGLVAAGLEDGSFAVLDPRAGYKVGSSDASGRRCTTSAEALLARGYQGYLLPATFADAAHHCGALSGPGRDGCKGGPCGHSRLRHTPGQSCRRDARQGGWAVYQACSCTTADSYVRTNNQQPADCPEAFRFENPSTTHVYSRCTMCGWRRAC